MGWVTGYSLAAQQLDRLNSVSARSTPTMTAAASLSTGLLPTSFPTTGATETVEVDPPRGGPGSSPSASHTGAGTFRSPQEQAKDVVSQVCAVMAFTTSCEPQTNLNFYPNPSPSLTLTLTVILTPTLDVEEARLPSDLSRGQPP